MTALRKRFIVIGIFSALLIAAVCFLPWPSIIDAKMYGTIVTEEGETTHEVQFIVAGWKLDYLFRRDKLKVDITFIPNSCKPFLMYVDTSGTLYSTSSSYYLTGYIAYQTNENLPVGGYFAITSNYDYCILTSVSSSNDYIIGSVAPDVDLDAILDVFERRLP